MAEFAILQNAGSIGPDPEASTAICRVARPALGYAPPSADDETIGSAVVEGPAVLGTTAAAGGTMGGGLQCTTIVDSTGVSGLRCSGSMTA